MGENMVLTIREIFIFAVSVVGIVFIGMFILAKIKKGETIYKNEPEQQNPFLGKRVIFVKNEAGCQNAVVSRSFGSSWRV